MGVLGMANGMDMSMDHVDVSALGVGTLSMNSEDEMVKRLDNIINILGVGHIVVEGIARDER